MVIFDKEECQYLRSFYYRELEHSADTIQDYTKVKIKFSNSSLKYVTCKNTELLNFLSLRLKDYGVKSIPLVKFLKYKSGDHLARHTDFSKYGTDIVFKTYIFQLSDSNDYKGGDLIVGETIQSRDLGSMVIINPTTPHEVTEVVSGERISLVLFLLEEHLNIQRTLI
jgi:predicted 2-oxoglutarate/Fe(II)-dependent dioxygenase YbiX